MLEKIKMKLGIKPRELTQLERVRQSLLDSIENRIRLKYETGEEVEDTQYLSDCLKNLDELDKKIKEEKRANRNIILKAVDRLPKIDTQLVSSLMVAGSSIAVCLLNLDFAHKCIEMEEDGEVVPTRRFSYLRSVPQSDIKTRK